MLRLPTMILAAMIAGCANHQVAKRQPVMVLDNNGGFSHAGRRIELFEGGGASEISYTDVADAQHVSNGTYELRGDRLALKFGDRGDQSLHRVTYGGKAYWVYAKESEKIMRPGSSWLRQTSLKQQGEQVIDANLPSTSQSPRSANH